MISVPIHAKPLRRCQVFPVEGQTEFTGLLRWANNVALSITRSKISKELSGDPGSCVVARNILIFSEDNGGDEQQIISTCDSCTARYNLHMRRERGI